METRRCLGCGTWIPFYEEGCPFCEYEEEDFDEDEEE